MDGFGLERFRAKRRHSEPNEKAIGLPPPRPPLPLPPHLPLLPARRPPPLPPLPLPARSRAIASFSAARSFLAETAAMDAAVVGRSGSLKAEQRASYLCGVKPRRGAFSESTDGHGRKAASLLTSCSCESCNYLCTHFSAWKTLALASPWLVLLGVCVPKNWTNAPVRLSIPPTYIGNEV